jgi:hypothetical protein
MEEVRPLRLARRDLSRLEARIGARRINRTLSS